MKRILFFIILIVGFKGKAQEKNNFYNALKSTQPFYITKSIFLSDSLFYKSFTYIYAESFYNKNEIKHPFTPNNSYGINLKSEGFKKFKKYKLYGKIHFNERYDNGSLGKNYFSSKYLSPYYLLDTLQKDWKFQKITAKAIINNYLTRNINTELTATYTAQHKVNYQFPKPLLYGNSFKIQPTIGYKINKNYKIALGYSYENSKYEVTIDDGAVSQVKIFSITGVGNLTSIKGFGSNYRYVNNNSNSIFIKGIYNLTKNKTFSHNLSLENTNQKGFDDFYKNKSIFNYNEWLSKIVAQLNITKPLSTIVLKYQLLYQSGKGTYLQPKINNTFTEKLEQNFNVSHYNIFKKEQIGFSIKHLHERESNSIYANFYDFDYLLLLGNYTKTLNIATKKFHLYSSLGYQIPIYQKNRFVKKNPYINHFLLPFINFYNQEYFYIYFSPSSSFLLSKNNINIGFNTQITLNFYNQMNLFNSLYIKANF